MSYKPPFIPGGSKAPFLDNVAPPFTAEREPFLSHTPPNPPRESLRSENSHFLPDAERSKGLYIAGNPGSGKSSLIQNLVLRDIHAGYGVCVIDPSGDLIRKADSQDSIIDWIPESRLKDVIYFNTSDCVRSLDLFSCHDLDERRVMIDELVAMFKLENAPKAKPLLRRVLSIMLDANPNPKRPQYTFYDLKKFIEDESFREKVANEAGTTFYKLQLKDFESILWRFLPFEDDPVLREIISSHEPEINLWDVIQGGKILLVDLNDTETDFFIGSLIVAKIQQATFRRRTIKKSWRDQHPFFVYVDEFHAIAATSGEHFNKMLTRGRKYNVCLTFANPYPDDDEIPSSIQRKLPGFATKFLFNLDDSHSRIFRAQLLPIETLNYLKPFSAAFIRQGKRTVLIDTPRYLDPNPAGFAQSITKRSTPLQTPSISHDDGDGPERIDYDNVEGEP